MSDMNDKVALITGASSGIGRATGEAFAARGAEVILAARREPELATLTSEIESRGGRASFVVTDVAIAKDVERMVAHAIETFGRLDYAVNNAGIEGKFAGITDLPEEEWDRVLDTNLKGTLLCLQYEARAMLAGGHGGAIVNVGSVNSFLGFPPARHTSPRNTGKSGSLRAFPRNWHRRESGSTLCVRDSSIRLCITGRAAS